uniref:Mitochondrial thiamine pyrophosphate carrier n=1 Tax=Melanaphis sacchari TaxID=742174 RepID=A0A2H8TY22_9HEMI
MHCKAGSCSCFITHFQSFLLLILVLIQVHDLINSNRIHFKKCMYLTLFIFQIVAHDNRINSVKQFSSGFLAGVSAKIIVYPLDVIKKRLQLQDFIHSRDGFGKKFICNGLLNCIYVTVKEESIRGFFKGLSPSLIKAGFTTALHLTLYEQTFKLLQSLVNNF